MSSCPPPSTWLRLSLLILAAVLTCTFTAAHGQSKIEGTVRDARSGTPLPNANVFLQGTTHGTATNAEGDFAISDVRPGSYAVIVSMVGYVTTKKDVRLYNPSKASEDTSLTLTVKLSRKVRELKGVSVEANRDEWLDRLDEFRSAFLGNVPHAGDCEFVNPEVLSFEERGDGLVAHAKEPLRIRNEGLGYEVTYHVKRYRVSPDRRHRYGKYEFDTLRASGEKQRAAWREARKRSYRGSFRHFIRSLSTGSLEDNGFQIGRTSTRRGSRARHASAPPEPEPVDPSTIYESGVSPHHGILAVPPGTYLEVRYLREGEDYHYARNYRQRSPRSEQTSWVEVVGGSSVRVNLRTGDFTDRGMPGFGYYVLTGYWGWHETAATVLPANYRPPGE